MDHGAAPAATRQSIKSTNAQPGNCRSEQTSEGHHHAGALGDLDPVARPTAGAAWQISKNNIRRLGALSGPVVAARRRRPRANG